MPILELLIFLLKNVQRPFHLVLDFLRHCKNLELTNPLSLKIFLLKTIIFFWDMLFLTYFLPVYNWMACLQTMIREFIPKILFIIRESIQNYTYQLLSDNSLQTILTNIRIFIPKILFLITEFIINNLPTIIREFTANNTL